MTDESMTHLNDAGEARMVDVGSKEATDRVAVATATITCRLETLAALKAGDAAKGDVLAAARIAGIMAAKRTSELIPLCHPIGMTHCEVSISDSHTDTGAAIQITVTAKTRDRTGIEMEAMVGASIAALTIYDMCKSIDRAMVIGDVYLVEKRGGKSGHFKHPKGDAPVL
jgi:cyclic pyranopterin phosphate synthase